MFSLRSMLRGNVLGITFSLCEGRSVIRPTMASGLLWRQRRTPESVVTMCYQTTCCSCGKPTWAGPGCGAHIDSTLHIWGHGARANPGKPRRRCRGTLVLVMMAAVVTITVTVTVMLTLDSEQRFNFSRSAVQHVSC